MKACFISGIASIPPEKMGELKRELRSEIMQAVESGYTAFICGIDSEVDIEFATIVAEIKEYKPDLYLEAVLAHPGKTSERDERFQALLANKKVNGIRPVPSGEGPEYNFALNRYMVGEAMRVIAVFDGDGQSSTAQVLRMSAATEREVRMIKI